MTGVRDAGAGSHQDDGDPGAAARILRAYGVESATLAETRARAGVLDRMGAFAAGERAALVDAEVLGGRERHHRETP